MASTEQVNEQFRVMQQTLQAMNERLELQQKQGEEIMAQLNAERREKAEMAEAGRRIEEALDAERIQYRE